MADKHRKRPRDLNQWAKQMVDTATGLATEPGVDAPAKNAAAIELGRRGGLKGGKARAAKMSSEHRNSGADIARKAAKARWNK